MKTRQCNCLGLAGLWFVCMATSSACELPEWQARYNIIKYSTTVARVTMTLHSENKQAQYRLHTKPVGLLAAFSNEELTELSELIQTEDKTWQLQKFSQLRSQDNQRNQQFTLQLNENNMQAEGTDEGKAFKMNVAMPAWDRSSVQLALTCDLLATNKPQPAYDYTIIDSAQTSNYHFEYRGADTIRIADKKIEAYKFERISGDRSTLFWLAPSMKFMPVFIEQYKKGKLHLRMKLDLPTADSHYEP